MHVDISHLPSLGRVVEQRVVGGGRTVSVLLPPCSVCRYSQHGGGDGKNSQLLDPVEAADKVARVPRARCLLQRGRHPIAVACPGVAKVKKMGSRGRSVDLKQRYE